MPAARSTLGFASANSAIKNSAPKTTQGTWLGKEDMRDLLKKVPNFGVEKGSSLLLLARQHSC